MHEARNASARGELEQAAGAFDVDLVKVSLRGVRFVLGRRQMNNDFVANQGTRQGKGVLEGSDRMLMPSFARASQRARSVGLFTAVTTVTA